MNSRGAVAVGRCGVSAIDGRGVRAVGRWCGIDTGTGTGSRVGRIQSGHRRATGGGAGLLTQGKLLALTVISDTLIIGEQELGMLEEER